MDTTIWHDLVMIGTGLAVAAYSYVRLQDPAFDTSSADDEDDTADDDWDGCE